MAWPCRLPRWHLKACCKLRYQSKESCQKEESCQEGRAAWVRRLVRGVHQSPYWCTHLRKFTSCAAQTPNCVSRRQNHKWVITNGAVLSQQIPPVTVRGFTPVRSVTAYSAVHLTACLKPDVKVDQSFRGAQYIKRVSMPGHLILTRTNTTLAMSTVGGHDLML
jgi:hypothetical protein